MLKIAIFVSLLTVSLAGCSINQQHKQQRVVPNHFAMKPARLETGHIFMRRTGGWAALTQQMKEQKERREELALNNTKEYIKPDGTIVRKRGIVGSEYNKAIEFLPPHEWIDIRTARVAAHVENKPFKELIEDVMRDLMPYTGPWKLQWKVSYENLNLLDERFSLNTETTFSKFIADMSAFILNYSGLELTFEMFEKERVLIISDKM